MTDPSLATAVLRDPATWSSDRVDGPRPAETEAWTAELVAEEPALAEVVETPTLAILGLDPPDHTRLRRALVGHLSAARIRHLEPVVDAAVADLLVTDGEIEAVSALCAPLPVRVTGALLGVAGRELDTLAALARTASTSNLHVETRDRLRERLHAELGLLRAFTTATAAPGSLLEALRDDDALTRREALGLAREVIVAGTETTADHLASVLLLLARDDDGLLARVRDDARAREVLIEEALRIESPFPGFWRRATRDTELAGVAVARDDLLLVPFGRLNRDPDRFPDPAAVDLDRDAPRGHLAFGHGIHFCIGAPLARLVSERLLAALLPRLDAVELVEEPRWRADVAARGVDRLTIRLRPR